MVRAIGNDNGSTLESAKAFTPALATQMLPLVRRITNDMITLSQSIQRQREQLRGIDSLPDTMEQPNYQEELNDVRASLADDERRLELCVAELASLGVQPHLPIDGTVDFPATVNRRSVRLCWHPNDDSVCHWHEAGEASEKRQRISGQQFDTDSLN